MKKIIVLVFCAAAILSLSGTSVLASEVSYNDAIDNQIDTTISRANVVEYKYRTKNRRLQYRRWNITQNCWIDPDWIYL